MGGVVGVFVAVLFHVMFLLGITAEGATAVPGVLFDFVASPLSFFSFFAFFLLGVEQVNRYGRISATTFFSSFVRA